MASFFPPPSASTKLLRSLSHFRSPISLTSFCCRASKHHRPLHRALRTVSAGQSRKPSFGPFQTRKSSFSTSSTVAKSRGAQSQPAPSAKSRTKSSPPKKPSSKTPHTSKSKRSQEATKSSTSSISPAEKKEGEEKETEVEEYTDTSGLPLDLDPEQYPQGELSAEELHDIFGKLEPYDANHVLRVLQYRRVEGTLQDVGVAVKEVPRLTNEQAEAGLAWLRKTFPIDEEAAYNHWAENEASKLEWEISERRRMREAGEKHWEYEMKDLKDVRAREKSTYGEDSFMDRVYARAERRKRDREEDEKKKAAQALAEAQQEAEVARIEGRQYHFGPLVPAWRKTELTEVKETPEWVQYYRKRGQLTDSPEAPEMTNFQRLWPATLFTAASLLICAIIAAMYEPSSQAARIFPNIPPAATTCAALIGMNLIVFILWRFPQFYRAGNKYFHLVPGLPTAFSLLGSAFSHQSPAHLAMNMSAIWFIGTSVHDEIGRGKFIALYLASAVGSGFVTLFINVLRRNFVFTTMGASGIGFGLVTATCLLVPKSHVQIPFVEDEVPINKQVLLGILVAFEVYNLFRGGSFVTLVDHYAHLGGVLMGALGIQYLRWLDKESEPESVETTTFETSTSSSSPSTPTSTSSSESSPGAVLEKSSVFDIVGKERKG